MVTILLYTCTIELNDTRNLSWSTSGTAATPTQAAIFCGVSGSSASTVCYRLKNRVMDESEIEQREALKGYAPKALHQIQTQAETAVSKNVNLNANCDLLDRAGWNPVEKSEVTEISDLQNMINEELQAELDALYKADGKKHRGCMNIQ